jgi:DNA repair exonuclease SbcCD ATPase subunit
MINSIYINNWKAFSDRKFSFSKGMTFFVGQNGAGKTTLLDAICLAVTGKSPTAHFQELVRQPRMPAEVRLEMEVNGNQICIARKFRKDRKLIAEMVLDDDRKTMSWDDLTSEVLSLLSVDEMFFNRLTYMSEGEVFRYLEQPPSEALNSKVQEIFGIASLQTLKEFTKTIRKNLSSTIRDTSSELRTIGVRKSIDASEIPAIERALAAQKEQEIKIQEEKESLTKLIRDIEGEKKNYAKLKELITHFTSDFKEEITRASEEYLDDALSKVIKDLDREIVTHEEGLRKNEVSIGSIGNRLTYLKDIENLLQSVIAGTAEKAEVPCPVCKRPVDKALADRLIHETQEQIRQTEQNLTQAKNKSKTVQDKIRNLQQRVRKAREYETRLTSFPSTIKEKVKPLTSQNLDRLLLSVDSSLKENTEAESTKLSALKAIKQEIEQKMSKIAELRAQSKQAERVNLLGDRLYLAYQKQMLAELISNALESTLQEQRDHNLAHVYVWISELWRRFRPDSEWQILLDEKGVIKVKSKERQYDFSHLSGGEKTVLLVLARVILCRLLATNIDFLMIDEPLEHLDIRNRRSLLNFLVAVCRKNVIPQMLVTTFEESLVRKYYEGEDTNVELLQ